MASGGRLWGPVAWEPQMWPQTGGFLSVTGSETTRRAGTEAWAPVPIPGAVLGPCCVTLS